MAIAIETLGTVAVVSDGLWLAPHQETTDLLNAAEQLNYTGLTDYSPNRDEGSAHMMLDHFGGKILKADPPSGSPADKNRVY